MDIPSMTDAELFANLQAISGEIQKRMFQKDASIVQKNREIADNARSWAESERFLNLQLRAKNDEISRFMSSTPLGSPQLSSRSLGSPPSPFGSHSSEAVALKGKQVTVKHPVKGLPAIAGVISLESHTSRILLNGVGGFMWAGEVTRDLSSGTLLGLQFTGSNALEHFPGGSTATFSLDAHGYAHGPFTTTFPGGSVAGTEMYEHGVKAT